MKMFSIESEMKAAEYFLVSSVLLSLGLLSVVVLSHSWGAPPESCRDLKPQHGYHGPKPNGGGGRRVPFSLSSRRLEDEEDGRLRFKVLLEDVGGGESDEDGFRGFMLQGMCKKNTFRFFIAGIPNSSVPNNCQAWNVHGVPVGRFAQPYEANYSSNGSIATLFEPSYQVTNCSFLDDTATHADATKKTHVEVTWVSEFPREHFFPPWGGGGEDVGPVFVATMVKDFGVFWVGIRGPRVEERTTTTKTGGKGGARTTHRTYQVASFLPVAIYNVIAFFVS